MAFIHMDKDMLRYIRADDMNIKFATYYEKDAFEIIKQVYLSALKLELVDDVSKVALEYTDKARQLGWTKEMRHITLTKMPYNAKHLITLQNFLLWAAKQKDVKNETKKVRRRVKK